MTSIYNDYFGLKESPFSIAPNPQYLYMSNRHREALAHLMYGIQGDGAFILLSGEVGTGKTTICRCLLEQIPTQVDTAFILNPKLTAAELLAAACDDLKISYPQGSTIKVLTDCINAYLLDAHANDPLGGLNMQDIDFANITTMIRDLADQYADGRIVSILEGGYDLDGLRDSACAHLNALR